MATPEHDWSGWVHLALEWGDLSVDGLGLLLTIGFGKHHMKVVGGEAWFGFHSGELEIKPINATIPYENRWPDSPFPAEIKITRSVSNTETSRQSQSASGEAKGEMGSKGPSSGVRVARKKEGGRERTQGRQDVFEDVLRQVTTRGSPERAYWDFEARTGDACLQGRLNKQEICRLELQAKPCEVSATFQVFKKDVRFLNGEGLWPEDLAKVKKSIVIAILRRSIAKKWPIVISRKLHYPV